MVTETLHWVTSHATNKHGGEVGMLNFRRACCVHITGVTNHVFIVDKILKRTLTGEQKCSYSKQAVTLEL